MATPSKLLSSVITAVLLLTVQVASAITAEEVEAGAGVPWTDKFRANFASTLKQYNKNKSHKAIAVALSADNRNVAVGLSWEGQSQAAAAQIALQYCEQDRQTTSIQAPCEIVIANQTVVPLGKTFYQQHGDAPPSNAWLIEGGTAPFHLIGTIHVLKPTMFPLPAVYDQVFDQAEQVALEVNPILMSEPTRASAMQQAVTMDPKVGKQSMPRAVRRSLRTYLKSQGARVDNFYGLKPVITSLQLTQLSTVALGYSGNAGFDLHYARRASAEGKAIIELEDPIAAMRVMTDLPMQQQYLLLDDTLEQIDQSGPIFEQLLRLWMAADMEGLYQSSTDIVARAPELETFMTEFLDGRNKRMLATILPLLEGDKATVAMAGAAHLGGPAGLIPLLRQAGYNPVQLTWQGQPVATPDTNQK
ncbi:MAG: TraB/GumN family protein [Pseudomonadota bacterium]